MSKKVIVSGPLLSYEGAMKAAAEMERERIKRGDPPIPAPEWMMNYNGPSIHPPCKITSTLEDGTIIEHTMVWNGEKWVVQKEPN